MWSDESGLKECTRANTHPPSSQWSWVGAWIPTDPAPGLYFTNKYLICSRPNRVSGGRVGRGLRCPGRDGQRGLAVRCRLPCVRHHQRSKPTQSDRCNVSVSFLQQHVPRTQNHEGLCQTQKMDEVSRHAVLRCLWLGSVATNPVFRTQEVQDRAERPVAAGAAPKPE